MSHSSPSPGPSISETGTLSPAEERFERGRRLAGVALMPAAFLLTYFLTQGRLSPEGQRLSAILAAVAVLWMTETLPLPVTALFGVCLCVLLGVADVKAVLAPFADPIVFLFIGSFMLARAMMIHGLHRRMALGILSLPWVSRHPARVLAAVGLVTATISMWVSNTATTAMMTPIALGVLQALHEARERGSGKAMAARSWPYAAGMMLMVAYAASTGGIGTPVGSPPNLITIGALRKQAGISIDFVTWMGIMLPMTVVMCTVLFVLLYRLHPAEATTRESLDDLNRYLREQRQGLGPWTRGQRNTLAAFAVALTLWIVPGVLPLLIGNITVPMSFKVEIPASEQTEPSAPWAEKPLADLIKDRVPEAIAALIAALLLFVLPTNLRQGEFTLTWQEAARIDWGTILLFGGGLSLGSLMFSTGVAKAMGEGVTSFTGIHSLWGLTAVAVAMGIFLSETTSNTAAANMLLPAVIAMALENDISPVPPALGACLGASFGYMLPVSTPPNAIVYGTGLISIPKMARAGILFDLCGFVLIIAGLRLLCPLFGFSE